MQGWDMTSLFVYAVLSAFLKDAAVFALSVSSSPKIIGVNGSNAEFRINYALGSGETFSQINFQEMGGKNVFIAPFVIQMQRIDADGRCVGSHASRCSTDYSSGKTNFTITLSHITPDDEGQYTVEVTANNIVSKTAVSQLVVDILPGTPSISGAPTQPVSGGAGPTVLQCKANLGKPQASMVWSRRIGNAAYTNITENVNTTITNNNDGTSTLTVNLHTADNNVQFRCQVSNRQATRSAETGAIEVTDTTKLTENGDDGETVMPTETGEAVDTIKPTENGEGVGTIKPTAKAGDTTKLTENGEDGETVMPTETGKAVDTIKPTENGEGVGTIKSTVKAGVSAGHDDIPNKIVLGTAFVVMAMISTII